MSPQGYICCFFCTNGGPGGERPVNQSPASTLLLKTRPLCLEPSFLPLQEEGVGSADIVVTTGGLLVSISLFIFFVMVSECGSFLFGSALPLLIHPSLLWQIPKHCEALFPSRCPTQWFLEARQQV